MVPSCSTDELAEARSNQRSQSFMRSSLVEQQRVQYWDPADPPLQAHRIRVALSLIIDTMAPVRFNALWSDYLSTTCPHGCSMHSAWPSGQVR